MVVRVANSRNEEAWTSFWQRVFRAKTKKWDIVNWQNLDLWQAESVMHLQILGGVLLPRPRSRRERRRSLVLPLALSLGKSGRRVAICSLLLVKYEIAKRICSRLGPHGAQLEIIISIISRHYALLWHQCRSPRSPRRTRGPRWKLGKSQNGKIWTRALGVASRDEVRSEGPAILHSRGSSIDRRFSMAVIFVHYSASSDAIRNKGISGVAPLVTSQGYTIQPLSCT